MISRLFLPCLIVALLFFAAESKAQMRMEPSTDEDVAIAFFKTADTNPDFELWARNSKGFKSVAPARANEYLFDEKQRLMKIWQRYDREDPIIDIKAAVVLEIKATTDESGNEFYWMYISFGKEDAVYFPYRFQEYKIAVIPQLIETLMIQPLQKEQYYMMLKEFENKSTGTASMYLQLKPVKAYVHQPYKIDNEDQWALLTDIATMSIKSDRTGAPYWNYSADWYTSPVTEELRDLYQAPAMGGAAP